MKKLVAGLLAALLLCGHVVPAFAQVNAPQYGSLTLYNQGAPNLLLNDAGSFWGQVFDLPGSGAGWSLGVGTSQSANGSSVVTWNQSLQFAVGSTVPQATSSFEVGSTSAVRIRKNGWLEYHQNLAPSVSSCGTSPSVASGADMAGDATVGSSPSNTCTLTFAETPTQIPSCYCSDQTSTVPCVAKPTATTLVMVGSGGTFAANDVLRWGCLGWQ